MSINPHYDTKLGMKVCFDVEAFGTLWRNDKIEGVTQKLDVCASFGNMPEYRDNTKNLRLGLKFTSGNLWVQPELCVPGIDKQYDKIRILCSMGWRIKLKN